MDDGLPPAATTAAAAAAAAAAAVWWCGVVGSAARETGGMGGGGSENWVNAEAWPEVRRGPADVGVKGGWMRRGGAEARGEEGAVVAVAEAATAAASPWGKTTVAWSP